MLQCNLHGQYGNIKIYRRTEVTGMILQNNLTWVGKKETLIKLTASKYNSNLIMM